MRIGIVCHQLMTPVVVVALVHKIFCFSFQSWMATMLRGLARGQWTAASSKLGEMVVPGTASKRLAELTIPSTSALSRLCHRQTADPDREIYNGILSTQIKLVKGFSLTTSCIGLACQPVLLSYSSHANAAIILGAGAFLSFFTFATPLLIHTISKKYVTKLYYNQVGQSSDFSPRLVKPIV